MANSSGRVTLDDLTNLTAAELRRKRARERYASLPADQKEAKLKKNHEYRQRRRDKTTSETGSDPGMLRYPLSVSRKRARERYASLSAEQKQIKLQKNHEYKQRNKESTASVTAPESNPRDQQNLPTTVNNDGDMTTISASGVLENATPSNVSIPHSTNLTSSYQFLWGMCVCY